jgi:hypothetical protein
MSDLTSKAGGILHPYTAEADRIETHVVEAKVPMSSVPHFAKIAG